MSTASHALANALQQIGATQLEFAARCGIDRGQMNRYVRGTLDIGAANLATLARHLPEPQRSRVVAGWLHDHIPESARSSVVVSAQGDLLMNELPVRSGFQIKLRGDAQAALDYLAAESLSHTEIADLLVDLHRALRGDFA